MNCLKTDQQMDSLDLLSFKFPMLTGMDAAFLTLRTDPVLLAEAKRRGYYNGCKPGNAMFSRLFFYGGRVVFKAGISDMFKNAAWPYVRCFMRSFEPKHEEKEAICGMLLDELLESVEGAPKK